MELRRIHQDFSVCQVEDYSLVNFESQYCFIGKTDEEKSLVCATGEAPANAVRWIVDWQFQYFENRYNVIVWDAPAHGSSWPFRFDFDLFDKAKWLNDILNQEGITKPVIVGQSMGGYVGQAYAQLYPDKMTGFVSIDSAPLQRIYVTAVEIWLLKRMEPVYAHYPWKWLLKLG